MKYKDIKIGQTGTVFVINEYGELISHMNEDVLKYGKIDKNLVNKALSNKDKSFFIEQDGEVFLGFARTSYLTGWTTVGIVPVNELTAKMGRVKFAVYGITLLAILATLIAAVFISNTITNPIKKVIQSMEMFREGNFKTRIEVTGDYEISRLAEFFNLTVERIQKLILKEYELEKKKKEAELYVLQAQINPHFLYNTLESIVWKARSIGADDISYMASALGKLFRLAVNRGGPIVRVREEIEHVKAYVEIQNLRYGGKIQLTINVDDACILEFKTLKLILQPVVENAIFHGLEKTGREGAINIEVYVKNDCLEFVISDNGMGMSSNVLDMLNSKIASGEDSEVREKRGIGLINIHERIELYFGDGYGIKVSSSEGSGTTVKITTPILI
jgi:two-component system sensor histidine kinase YesM